MGFKIDILPDFLIHKIYLNLWNSEDIYNFHILNKRIYNLGNEKKISHHFNKVAKADKIIRRTNLEILLPEESDLFDSFKKGLLMEQELGPCSCFPGKECFMFYKNIEINDGQGHLYEILYNFDKKTHMYDIEVITSSWKFDKKHQIHFYWNRKQFFTYLYKALDYNIKFWNINREVFLL